MDQQQMTPEQQEELRKKVENMSPEELREFQKKQCIFCHIVNGKVNARKIYEDDKVIAVLDINPGNPGHVLLMPKEHYMIMPQLPEDVLKHIFIIAKQLSNALLKALDVRGTNIIVANGPAAGQRAQHFMIHIIPRKEGDKLQFELPTNKHSESDLDNAAEAARKRLNELLGKPLEEKQFSAGDILNKPKKGIVDAEFEEDEDSGNRREEKEDEGREGIVEKEEKDSDEEEDTEESDDEGDEDASDEGDSDDNEEDDTDEKKDNSDDDSDKEEDIDLDNIARVLNG